MTKDKVVVPEFYKTYINAIKEQEVIQALKKSDKRFRKCLKEIAKEKRDYAYAEGKWTIRQLLQHMIDTERVFCFRALWFARRDPNPQPGFDENKWAEVVNRKKRKWRDLVNEYRATRESTIRLFESFTKEDMKATGIANNNPMSVAAFGFVAAGHIEHHIHIIKSRYFPISIEQAL